MSHDPAFSQADVFTHHHRYSGQVATRGNRLSDLLNDPTAEILEMSDVTVSQPANKHSSAIQCGQVLLKKETILLAVPTGSYEAPRRRAFNFVEKHRYAARVVVPGHTLVGTLYLPSRANAWMLMRETGNLSSFMPITDVMVQFAIPGADPIPIDVVIFRRGFIESISLSETPLGGEGSAVASERTGEDDAMDLVRQLIEEQRRANEQSDEETVTLPLRNLTPVGSP